MIKCNNVTKLYGPQIALDGVNLEIDNGEFIAIMGPSGSGKSTLLNLLAGIDKVSNGEVLFDNQDFKTLKIKDLEKIRQLDMGFIFQEYHILNSLSARENIALPLTIQKIKKKEILERVQRIAQELEIDGLLDKLPYQLSGGEKQRVAIARALIIEPKVVFADEPTGALDSKNAHRLLNNLATQNKTKGITTVMVTHDQFSASFASKVVFIKDGKIYHALEKGDLTRKAFYEQIIKVSMLLGGEFDAI
ncbi:MAG: ABC transporter ATP-binding protein [Erysipelotrichales bacterium]